VHRARGLKVGYLPQEAVTQLEGTLWSSCLLAFEDLIAKGEELRELEKLMQDPACDPSVLERYGKVQTVFENSGGYTYHARIRQTLDGLGFSETDYERPLKQLSGGQRTRARLARILVG